MKRLVLVLATKVMADRRGRLRLTLFMRLLRVVGLISIVGALGLALAGQGLAAFGAYAVGIPATLLHDNLLSKFERPGYWGSTLAVALVGLFWPYRFLADSYGRRNWLRKGRYLVLGTRPPVQDLTWDAESLEAVRRRVIDDASRDPSGVLDPELGIPVAIVFDKRTYWVGANGATEHDTFTVGSDGSIEQSEVWE